MASPTNDAATQLPPDTSTSESGNIPGQRRHDVASASDNAELERSNEPNFELCELVESLVPKGGIVLGLSLTTSALPSRPSTQTCPILMSL